MEANLIKEILHRKAKGIDCTEDESAKLKGFIKKTDNSSEWDDNMIRLYIAEYFPIEYSEAIQELQHIK